MNQPVRMTVKRQDPGDGSGDVIAQAGDIYRSGGSPLLCAFVQAHST